MSKRSGTAFLLAVLSIGTVVSCGRQVAVESGPAGNGEGSGASEEVLTSDLQRLAMQQETYRAEHARYALDVKSLGYEPWSGSVVDILEATSTGFSAIASTVTGDTECAYFTGSARAPRGYVSAPDQVFCRS